MGVSRAGKPPSCMRTALILSDYPNSVVRLIRTALTRTALSILCLLVVFSVMSLILPEVMNSIYISYCPNSSEQNSLTHTRFSPPAVLCSLNDIVVV